MSVELIPGLWWWVSRTSILFGWHLVLLTRSQSHIWTQGIWGQDNDVHSELWATLMLQHQSQHTCCICGVGHPLGVTSYLLTRRWAPFWPTVQRKERLPWITQVPSRVCGPSALLCWAAQEECLEGGVWRLWRLLIGAVSPVTPVQVLPGWAALRIRQ